MGAVTVAIKKSTGYGAVGKIVIADVTFSGTYAAGGDTYTEKQFGLTTIDGIQPLGPAVASATTGYAVMPDLAAKKLRLLGSNITTAGLPLFETTTATQSATVVRVAVYGDDAYV